LLSRVADCIYWAARYVERAEDTARIVRAHGETAADMPMANPRSWKPLITIVGSDVQYDARFGDEASETAVVTFLLSDRENGGSVVSCIGAARENLRTTRETVPRDGWHTLNDLSLYVNSESDRGIDRRVRERFLGRVIADSRRLDGVLATSMTHDEAYAMWRLGRALERAEMTTRVLGVRAAAVLSAEPGSDEALRFRYDDLQWMGVLKSLSALQMYQRAVRGPIDGPNVVCFLLEHDRFPRAVRALLREMRRALGELPEPGVIIDELDTVDAKLRGSTDGEVDGAELDRSMDELQLALAQLDHRITDRYLRLA
jgi:uncharacterized alpha-E superfamily protein